MTVSNNVNRARRQMITGASCVVGAAATIGVAWPFVASWQPSEKAKSIGAPIDIDFTKLPEGAQQRALWRGKAIYVIRMTQAMRDSAAETATKGLLLDPDSTNKDSALPEQLAGGTARWLRDDIMVMVGVCTHLGCAPLMQGVEKGQSHTPGWLGGFFCPCHGSKFDYTGRVYTGVPAPVNLHIPPYFFKTETVVRVGEVGNQEGAA